MPVFTQTLGPATTYAYTSGTNRLASITNGGTVSVSTNADGSITSIPPANGTSAATFAYNVAGRLASVTGSPTAISAIVYDGFGQRFSKQNPSTTAYYTYGTDGTLLEENDNGAVTDYIYLNGVPVGVWLPGTSTLYYVQSDWLGTPQMVTDSSQNVVWSTRYQPFGTTPTPTGSITQNLRLPGQYSDAETGFNYNYFRDYMPSLGRYLESDPIGLAGGLNTYLYANANAGRFTDPNGLRTNINLYPWGSPQWISAENTATLSNVFVVAGHGNEESLAGLDADELADMILDHLGQDYIPGERILLLSCKTGVKEPGQTLNAQMSPIAQLLANILGAEVDAPNDFIWMYQNGTYAVAPPSIFGGPGPSLGRFLPFYPRISDNSVVR